ncbi:MAG: GlsB/YeaQ/YmgE family stress response membrane protein [Streptosporangiaceae bacterium]
MVTFIIVLVIVGLIAGAIARLLVPGRGSMGIVATILLGIVGSWPAASKKSSADALTGFRAAACWGTRTRT